VTRSRLLAAALGLAGVACSGARDPPGDSKLPPATSTAVAPTGLDLLVLGGESTYARGEFDSAQVFFETALTQARASHDTAREAGTLTWLGLTAWREGDYGRARTLGEQALELKQRAGLRAQLHRSYNALGLLAADEGRLADALVLHQKAAEVARAGADESGLAKSANNVALIYDAQGKFAQARAGYLEARTAGRKLGEARTEGRALSNLAALDVRMGNPGSAIPALKDALVLLRSVDDRTGEQNALGQLGTAYDALGEPRLAFAALESALTAARKQGLRQEEASNLELIAGLHRQAGDLPRALRLYEQANQLNAEIGLMPEQGSNLRNSAEILAALGRPDLARANALEALRLHRATGARLFELRDLLLLADLAAAAAEPPGKVEARLREAERLSVTLDARIARVEVALTRAAIANRTGRPRAVLDALQQAQGDLAAGGYGNEWQAGALRARAYARLSLLDSAVAEGRNAVAALERVREGFGSSYLRSSYAVDKAEPYADLVDVLLRLDRTAEAFEVADAARSHALLEHLAAPTSDARAARATVHSLAEGEAILRRIAGAVAQLDTLEETPPSERDAAARARSRELATSLTEARGEYEALLVKLAEQDVPGTTLLGGRGTRAEEVQRVLQPDEAVLEYLVTLSRVITLVVTRDAVRSIATEIPREDLARRVRLARDLVGVPGQSAEAVSVVLTALHSVLVAPVERAGLLRGVHRLVLVPHSVLAYVPFAALKGEGTGRYLMEGYSLLLLPSAAALGALREVAPAPASGGQAVAMTAFAPFPEALPGSSREVAAVRRVIPGAKSREGRKASELQLRAALSSGRMVHAATHGVMNPRNPMFSRIELVSGNGAGDDDGRLEVHELLALHILAPLVFLSGCETGVGASWFTQFARGEDYATLAQAFLYAGARNVAATLWPIGDNGAAVFAERFYGHFLTLPPGEALAAAQREMLRDRRYAGPYYWAGYQMFGQGESVVNSHRPSPVSVQRE
jgi:CHAT domain-containing protein/tetratricopeptide (TPR) repeat protein